MVFHDLVNPCPTTSLTLSHVKEQGYRGGSVGGSFSCGRSGAIRDFKGMGGQTHGPLANRRPRSCSGSMPSPASERQRSPAQNSATSTALHQFRDQGSSEKSPTRPQRKSSESKQSPGTGVNDVPRLDKCGAEGNRTPGLLIANETRYQLRYSPFGKHTVAAGGD